jgi:hypothetical protein
MSTVISQETYFHLIVSRVEEVLLIAIHQYRQQSLQGEIELGQLQSSHCQSEN